MNNELLLLSGEDILLDNIVIHQPTIKEIAFIGEESFFSGCELLRFSKDNLEEKDKVRLTNYTNFEILMSMVREKNPVMQKNKIYILELLTLMFPKYQISLDKGYISLYNVEIDKEFKITKNNFEEFKNIMELMFGLVKDDKDAPMYNPSGEMAKRIAEKLRKRHQKLTEKNIGKKVAILSRYISILAAAAQKDMTSFFDYTVFQLLDEFKRYQLKVQYDIYFQAKLAGAQDLKEPEDWMNDIHPEIK